MKLLRVLLAPILISLSVAGAFALDVPALQGRVNDYAKVLTEPHRLKLEQTLSEIETRTKAQIVILTVESLKGEEIRSFGLKVGRAWGIGQKNRLDGDQKKDNGIVVLNAIDDRKVRIEVGKGLEGPVPDGLAGAIIDKMKPLLAEKDYFAAYQEGIRLLAERIDAEYGTGEKKKSEGAVSPSSSGPDFDLTLLAFLVPLVFAGLAGAAHPFAGGVVGAAGEAFISSFWFGSIGIIIAAIIGLFLGLIAKQLLGLFMDIGESGLLSSGSSGSSGGGFSGGGGGFGGGGSDDDY